MQANEPVEKWDHRGPMPPWPGTCDLATWLAMKSAERAEHLMRSAEKDGGLDEAEIERQTHRMTRFWDHLAHLSEMDSQARAEQIRRDVEEAWSGLRKVSGDAAAEAEIERQTERWIRYWDKFAAAGTKRAR